MYRHLDSSGQCRESGDTPGAILIPQAFARVLALVISLIPISFSLASASDKGQTLGNCGDSIRAGYHFYCDPDAEAEDDTPPEPPIEQKPAAQEAKTATEEMMAFRAELDELKYEAVLRPTPENLEAYMAAQLAMIRKAQEFTDVWQRVLLTSPALDTNTRYPLSNIGANLYQDQKNAAQEAALRHLAETRGLLFVFEHETTCPVCPLQASIVADLRDRSAVPVMAVTVDGWSYKPFPDVQQDNGQLKALGLEGFPRPILGMLDPTSGAIDVIGVGLITREEILERIWLLTEVEPGQRFAGEIP